MMLLAIAAVAATMLYIGTHPAVEDKNYHPICPVNSAPGQLTTPCIHTEAFIQKRGELDGMSFGTSNDGWDTDIVGSRPSLEPQKFSYGVIEYQSDKEPGKRWQLEQREAIIAAIRKSENPLYVVAFVHGWHHNAREERGVESLVSQDRNLLFFKHILAKRKAELVATKRANFEVLGVYVGWQGESIENDPFFTIGSRAKAADEIGNSQDFADDLSEIAKAVRLNPGSRLLVMGHSLGGRILSRYMLKQLGDTSKAAEARWLPLKENSLVVTINPAIGADAFDELMQTAPDDAHPLPTWINITSKDDSATGYIFSTAASLGRLVGIGAGVADHLFRASGYQAIGHYRPYQTHRLHIEHLGGKDEPVVSTVATEKAVGDKFCCGELGCTPKARCGSACKTSAYQELFACANATKLRSRVTDWYQLTGTPMAVGAIWFGIGTQCDSQFYVSTLDTHDAETNRPFHKPAGRMWNIVTDMNVIDKGEDETTGNARHNAFVQTSLGRMIDELLFAQEENKRETK